MPNFTSIFNRNITIDPEDYYNSSRVTDDPDSLSYDVAKSLSISVKITITLSMAAATFYLQVSKTDFSPENLIITMAISGAIGIAIGTLAYNHIQESLPERLINNLHDIHDYSTVLMEGLHACLIDDSN
jgi:hypothetical protein